MGSSLGCCGCLDILDDDVLVDFFLAVVLVVVVIVLGSSSLSQTAQNLLATTLSPSPR